MFCQGSDLQIHATMNQQKLRFFLLPRPQLGEMLLEGEFLFLFPGIFTRHSVLCFENLRTFPLTHWQIYQNNQQSAMNQQKLRLFLLPRPQLGEITSVGASLNFRFSVEATQI